MNNRIEYRPFEWVPNDFSLKGTDDKSYTDNEKKEELERNHHPEMREIERN